MIRDAWLAVLRRWHSTAFSVAAIAVGMLAVVATLGIAQSAASNVAASLRELSGTTATVRISAPTWERGAAIRERLLQVPGVVEAGLFTQIPAKAVAELPIGSARAEATGSVRVVIASGHGLRATGAHAADGVIPRPVPVKPTDSGPDASARARHTAYTDDSVVLGRLAAARLFVAPADGVDRLFVGDVPVRVAGLLGGADNALDNVLVISPRLAERLGVLPAQQSLLISHDGNLSLDDVALAAHPADPREVTVEMSLDPEALQASISEDTATLIVVLAGVTLGASGIGVANTMLTSVWQRRSEIGVMRAVGAPRSRVALMFLLEAGLIGLVGGVAGTLMGVLVGAGGAVAQGWTYTLPPLALTAPVVGVVVAMAFGLLPSLRAAGVSPAELLRAE